MKIKEIKTTYNDIYLIALSDLHIGDKGFTKNSETKLKGYITWIRDTPNAFAILNGDVLNCATRVSASSPFEQNMDLKEQIEKAVQLLNPIKNKIAGAIDGNHEQRLCDYTGYSPLISVCERLGITYLGDSSVYIFRLGCRKTKGNLASPRSSFTIYSHHCFDEQTELLTINGWKKYNELTKGDKVMSLNLNQNRLEWDYIKDIYIYNDFDKMIQFKTKSCDLMITKEHTLINKSRFFSKFRKYTANELLNKECNLPCSGFIDNKEYDINDDLLRLIAWVFTEGTKFKPKRYFSKIDNNYRYCKRNEIRITQSDKPKVNHLHILRIIRNLEKVYPSKVNVRLKYKKGITNGVNRNYDAYEIYINKSKLQDKINELLPNRIMPQWFFDLSTRQFNILLHELILGDGTDCGTNCSFSQKNKEDIDKLQALCHINGYRTVLSRKQEWGGYRLNITKRRTHRTKKESSKLVDYKGKAWCVSVKNGTLMVRRNGKVTITGNTTAGGRTVGAKINRVDMLRDIIANCDCYIGSHNHMLGVVHGVTQLINETSGTIETVRQMIIDSGGYLEWDNSYAEKNMLPPLRIGSPRIHLIVKRQGTGINQVIKKDVHVSI